MWDSAGVWDSVGQHRECGTVLDSASKHGMYSMGTMALCDMTMTNYGKFPEFADVRWIMWESVKYCSQWAQTTRQVCKFYLICLLC